MSFEKRRAWFKKLLGGFTVLAGASVAKTSLASPKRSVLHIQAGDDDWEPTTEEMQIICDAFAFAVDDPKGGVIVTRDGVKATVIDIQNLDGVKIVSAKVTSKDLPDGTRR